MRATIARLVGRFTPKTRLTLKNFVWLFADRFFRLGLGAVISIWIARYLGPEQFGIFNYALAFVALFSAFGNPGLDALVVRDLVKEPEAQAELLGTAFVLRLAGTLLSIVLAVGGALVLQSGEWLTISLIIILSISSLFQVFDTIDYYFQAHIQSKYTVIARNVAFLAASGIRIALLLLEAPLIAFAWVAVFELFVAAVGLAWVFRRTGQRLGDWRVSGARAREMLKNGLPLLLTGLAFSVQARIDQIFLGEMLGAEEVGQYAAALRLVDFLAFIPVILQSSLAPTAAYRKAGNEALYQDLLLNLYRAMTLLFLAVSIPVFLFADQIVHLLYGTAYQQAGLILAISTLRLLFNNLGIARTLYITNESLFRYSLVSVLVGATINVALNLVLIPHFASVGAIWASIVSLVVIFIVMDLIYPRTRPNAKLMLRAMATPWKFRLPSAPSH